MILDLLAYSVLGIFCLIAVATPFGCIYVGWKALEEARDGSVEELDGYVLLSIGIALISVTALVAALTRIKG